MARARNIKPGLFKNEILGQADPLLTILFEGLWCLADREGRLEDRPVRIKSEVLAYRYEANADAMLDWLHANGFILRYSVNGKRFIQVIEFKRHQNPHKNEQPSEIPGPDTTGAIIHGCSSTEKIGTTPDSSGSTRADSLSSDSLFSDSLNTPLTPQGEAAKAAVIVTASNGVSQPVRRGRLKNEIRLTDLRGDDSALWFGKMWDQWPKTGTKWIDLGYGKGREESFTVTKGSKAQAERNFQKIVDSGVATAHELAYSATFYWESDNPKRGFFQNVSTFFGPEKATWREYLDQARKAVKEESEEAS